MISGKNKSIETITAGIAEAAIPKGSCVIPGTSDGLVVKCDAASTHPILGIALKSYEEGDHVAVVRYGEAITICRTVAGIPLGSAVESSDNVAGGVITGTTPADTIGYARTVGVDGEEMVVDLIYNFV